MPTADSFSVTRITGRVSDPASEVVELPSVAVVKTHRMEDLERENLGRLVSLCRESRESLVVVGRIKKGFLVEEELKEKRGVGEEVAIFAPLVFVKVSKFLGAYYKTYIC